MSFLRMLSQPLTVQPYGPTGTKDRYNNEVLALGEAVDELGYLEQKDTVEYLLDRDTVVSKFKVFLNANSSVTELAVITYNGQQFQVDGAPWQVFNPRTKQVHHIECKLTVVS